MTQQEEKRRSLLGRLSRQFAYTAPALALLAGGIAVDATAATSSEGWSHSTQEEVMTLAGKDAEGEGEAEAEGEGEGEGEGEEEEKEAEGEGEAEG